MAIIVEHIESKERFVLLKGSESFGIDLSSIGGSGKSYLYFVLVDKNGFIKTISSEDLAPAFFEKLNSKFRHLIDNYDENEQHQKSGYYRIIEIDGKPISELLK